MILASCNATVRYHSDMLEHALYTCVAVAGATVGMVIVDIMTAAFC